MQDLQSDLDITKQRALQAIIENQEQQEEHTKEIRIKRISSTYQSKDKPLSTIIIISSAETTRQNVDSLIDKLRCEPQLLDNWLRLREVELAHSELNDLFPIFEIAKKKYLEEHPGEQDQQSGIKDIEQLLIDKYRLATLQEIAKQLPPYQKVTDNIELTPENTARYLIEAQKNDSNISHDALGTLNQYLYEDSKAQREEISKFCREELQSKNDQALKSSVRAFILEAGESEEPHASVKKYYNEHKEFSEKRERSLSILFDAFSSELSSPRHAEVLDLWNKSIEDESLRSKLEEKIQEDVFLKILYNRFNDKLKQEYDWNKCCKDQAVFEEYDNHIRKEAPLSRSYIELLACVFDINIRLYIENQENKLYLLNNHNPLSEKVIHVLYRTNGFIQLRIDKDYLNLEEERKKRDSLYTRIFVEVDSLKQKQELDGYLEKKAFLPDNDRLEDAELNPSFDDRYRSNEEEDIRKIIEYFPTDEQRLKQLLEKITSQYIGQQRILYYVLKCFSSGERHVSYQELRFLVNSILTFINDDRKVMNIFCWIVAACPQKSWIDELLLLQLEDYFKKPLEEERSRWKEYLSKIENKDILLLLQMRLNQYKSSSHLSTQCIEEILFLLSSIPNEKVALGELGLSEWPYALKEKYWTCRLSRLVDWQNDSLPTASYYFLSIGNIYGNSLAKEFIEALEKKKQELSSDTLTEILSNFHNEKWNLSKKELEALDRCNISEWIEKIRDKFTSDEKERDITQLVKLVEDSANTSERISDNLLKIRDSIQNINNNELISSFTEDNIKNWVEKFRSNSDEKKQDEKMQEEILAVIDRAIELKKGFKLRDTQKLTVLALLTNNSNTLAQVSTGEGKSLIVVAASIIKALCGKKVDIITSSSVLAKRDAEVNRDIYNLFDINASHNCSEDIEKRKEAYSSNQVVYGDLSNFQRDYLLNEFYEKNILGDRNFENVIVDEVDSMLLDKGNDMLYLSHDLAGLDKLESVYIYIWQCVNGPANNTKIIKEAVISDLYGLIKKEDIEKLGSELTEQHKNIIWERLVKAGILDNHGKLLRENIDDSKLNEILLPEFSSYKDRLNYLLRECIERERSIHVPNYLRPFIERHLESWINSAETAFFMNAGQDYVVDVDRTGTSPDRNPNITILDRDTGTDQANSQWDEALHQFLQLKHGCKLSLQSLKAVFISNVSFFKLYSELYGLTGTLGSQIERDLLSKIHKVDFVTIPTAKSKKFYEDKPILCTNKREWINRIRDEAKKLTEKRSVLIICETVDDVQALHKAFEGRFAKHVHIYTRDYEEFDKGFEVVKDKKELGQGQIIIATNLAGRGTDIKITKELGKARGLHVCLTYLPNNIRIEQQAFGRAARSGDQGSGQLIIMSSEGQEYSNLKILDLKKERDAEELHRVSDIKNHYETQITTEEDCFKKFKGQYRQLKKDLNNKKVPDEVKEILLQSCLDRWAFWLDENSKLIKNLTDEQGKRKLDDSLKEFISISRLDNLGAKYDSKSLLALILEGSANLVTRHDSKSWLAWVEENPVQMVKLGRYLSQNGKHENAIKLFDDVIRKEPYFSEAAHYYKASALAKKINSAQKPLKKEDKEVLKEFKQELREAARLLDEHSKFAISASGIISKIKENKGIIRIYAYEEQQKNLANLYYMLSRSIDDILGHAITPQSFINQHDIGEELAKDLYKDLLEKGILKKPRVEKSISEEELKVIASDYWVSVEELNGFLSEYKGREVNEKEFQKELKKKVPLPGREAFWKLLIEKKVLSEEVKYVIVNDEKLKEINPSLLDYLDEKVKKEELKKQTLEPNNEQVLLNVECVTQQKDSHYIFGKNDFIKIVGETVYKTLKEKGVLSFNKRAHIDSNKIKSTVFSCYDSITLEDFTKTDITKSEAEKILEELVKQKVLEKKDSVENSAYELKINFDGIKQVQLPSFPVYENAVRRLLFVCFAYRIALQKIEVQLKEGSSPIRLQLIIKPHQSLILELLERRIIRPTVLTTKDEDLEKKLKGESKFKNIVNTLKRSRGSLKTLEVLDGKLKPLTELCEQGEFANIEEVYIFSLNGLDQLLLLEEKKWTLKMLCNTGIITAIGIGQIVIGAAIELYSVGFMTHVGAAFISEGVSDIFFAAGALRSGHFSWGNYLQHKCESLMFTAVTVGVGAYLSRGSKSSRFGYKLFGPCVEIHGKEAAKTCGTQLLKLIVRNELLKRIASKAIEGIALGLANAGVDVLVENQVQALCESIVSGILSEIKQKVEEHGISARLKEVYMVLGRGKAEKFIGDLINSTFTERNLFERVLPTAKSIVSSITQGIAEALKKESKVSNKLKLPIHTINKVIVWSERATHIAKVLGATAILLDNLDQKIKDKLNNYKLQKNAEQGSLNQKQEIGKDYEEFKEKIIDELKSLLHKRAGQVTAQHIVSPILKKLTNQLVRYAEKNIEKAYQFYKERGYYERFEKFKQESEKNKQQTGNTSEIENHITKEYHENLRKLLRKTKNPKLFTAIIREGVEMDHTCVGACILVVNKMLERQVTIIVEGEVIRQEFPSVTGVKGTIIELELKGNHFRLHGSSASENNGSSESKNDCLYEALVKAIPELKDMVTTPEEFRAMIADVIEKDEKIQHRIKQGWHQAPISLGAYGGKAKREKTDKVPDSDYDSTSSIWVPEDTAKPGYEMHKIPKHLKVHKIHKHLKARLTHLFRCCGIVQQISEKTSVSRDAVLEVGASVYQDKNSGRGTSIHAAHIVRAGRINPKIEGDLKEIGKNFLGRTHNIEKYGNEWHKIGGEMDRFQEKALRELNRVNFGGSLTAEDADIITKVLNDFVGRVDGRIDAIPNDIKKSVDKEKLISGEINRVQEKVLRELNRVNFGGSLTAEDANEKSNLKNEKREKPVNVEKLREKIEKLEEKIEKLKEEREKLREEELCLKEVKTKYFATGKINVNSLFEMGRKGYSGDCNDSYLVRSTKAKIETESNDNLNTRSTNAALNTTRSFSKTKLTNVVPPKRAKNDGLQEERSRNLGRE